jgi:predicted N-acetyltransferase YhbS
MNISLRRLRPSDDRTTFDCGQVDLDRFFVKYAGQNQFRHHVGTTYVAVDDADRIVGFATVSPSRIEVRDLPTMKTKRLPSYPLPALRLARLAVHQQVQGVGVGSALLRAVFILAHQMAHSFGCVGVLVDAMADAIAYYKRYSLFELTALRGALGDRPKPTIMFLELGAIPNAADPPPGD